MNYPCDKDTIIAKRPDAYPAYNISYNDIIKKFLPRLNQITGIAYRLPTEAEWEYAARGGIKDEYTYSCGEKGEYFKFAGSNTSSIVANCSGEKVLKKEDILIKTKKPNALGIYDMSGNVWEWCCDWYGEYSTNESTNPTGPANGKKRVVRGGDWSNFSHLSRVSYRTLADPDQKCEHIGFRLVVDAK